ncbi:Beta-porphyranase A precursor [Planctomycetes bacterium MalM25]|nr:Beta-porphyranase A precursor [Planctomycetes bacterium MalM25]
MTPSRRQLLWLPLALLAVPTASGAPPAGTGLAWKPIPALSDEFNTQHPSARGDGIDYGKWFEDHPRWDGRMPSQFNPNNSWVEDGMLKIQATPLITQAELDDLSFDEQKVTHWIDTAAVVSTTQATVGSYYEASIKVANISLPSAFWFRMNSKSEIDVIENVGNRSNPGQEWKRSVMAYNTHFYNPPPDIAVGGKAQMVDENGDPLLSAENFITYAVWWKSPTEILFYYNDIEVANVTPGGPFDEGLHMIFDMEAFHWEGFPTIGDLNDPAKNTMQVDWVRAYQAVPLLPGDYDADGDIDPDDYARWQSEYGMSGEGLTADGNADGVVDAADYAVWRDALAGPGSSAIPEPGSAVLLLTMSVAAYLRRFRFFFG